MDALGVCLDQIGLSGLEGCTLDELWEHTTSVGPQIAPDDRKREYLWSQIIHCTGAVDFYKIETPRTVQPLKEIQIKTSLETKKWYEFTPPFPYSPVKEQEGDARGSCPDYPTWINVTSEIVNLSCQERTIDGINERYGRGCLLLVGSSELRARSLFPTHYDPSLCNSLPKMRYGVLEVIGQSRGWGMFRTSVTKFIKVDARTIFHHVKTLSKAGLIAIKVVKLGTRPMYTLFLKRFEPMGVISATSERTLCDLLSSSSNKTLPCMYLKQTMKRRYKTARASLLSKGIIEMVNLTKDMVPENIPSSGKGLRLVGEYTELVQGGVFEEKVEEEEDGGGEEGEEEEEEPNEDRHPLVAELPLTTQVYQLIDSHGPEGLPNPALLKSFNIDRYSLRMVSKSLLNSSSIVTILMDSTAVRTAKLISDRYSDQNQEMVDYHTQLAKHKSGPAPVVMTGKATPTSKSIKKPRINTEESHSHSTKSHSESPLPQPHSVETHSQSPESHSIDTDSHSTEIHSMETHSHSTEAHSHFTETPSHSTETHSQSQDSHTPQAPLESPAQTPDNVSLKEELVDVKPQLAQDVFVNYPLTIRQLKRINVINQYMEASRVENGHVGIMRRLKEVERLEGRTVQVDRRTLMKLLDYLIHTDQLIAKCRNIDIGGLIMEIKLYCVPDATDDEIQSTNENAEDWYKKVLYRRETQAKRNSSDVHTRAPALKPKKKKKKKTLFASDEESDDNGEERAEGEGEEEGDMEDSSDEEEMRTLDPKAILSTSKFQRIKHFHYYLWILAHGFNTIPDEKEGVSNAKTTPPFTLSELQYPWAGHIEKLLSCEDGSVSYSNILYNMPLSLFFMLKKIDHAVLVKFYKFMSDPVLYNTKISELPKKLRRIVAMRQNDVACINFLIDELVEMNLIHLNQDMSRDKSKLQVQLLRRADILDTANCTPRRSFFLVEAWSMFRTIEIPLNSLADLDNYWHKLQVVCVTTPIILGKERKARPLQTDVHPLYYTLQGQKRSRKCHEFNLKGFGAGGLAPLKFSHLPRNWLQGLPDYLTDRDGRGAGSGAYGPGMSLESFPGVGLDNMEDVSLNILGKKRSLEDKGDGTKRSALETVPSDLIQARSGGKGFQRKRARHVLRESLQIQNVVKQQKNKPSLYSLVCSKSEDAEDNIALSIRVGERSCWFAHEDNFLLLGYIASRVYFSHTKTPVDVSLVRDNLHKQFKTSKDKTTASVMRRLKFLLKKKNYNATISACTEEVAQELKLNESDEEIDFNSILKIIQQRYRSHDGHLININSIDLPSTLHELNRDYTMCGLDTDTPQEQISDPVVSQSVVNQDLLNCLIIMCLSATPRSYDTFMVYRQLENYPEDDLKVAVERLKTMSYVKSKKNANVFKRRGPLETQAFELSVNFYQRLEPHYSQTFSTELENAHILLDEWRSDPSPNRPIRINTAEVTGGHVALLVSELFDTNSNRQRYVSCVPQFPDPLLISDKSAEEEGGLTPKGGVASEGNLLRSSPEERDEGEEDMDTFEENEMLLQERGGADEDEATPIPDGVAEDETTPKTDGVSDMDVDSETTPIVGAATNTQEESDLGTGNETTPKVGVARTNNITGNEITPKMDVAGKTREKGLSDGGAIELHTTKCGVSTLLQLDELSELQHGFIDMGPSLNIGMLLDPLPEASETPREEIPARGKAVISLEEFTTTLASSIGYEERDVELAKEVYGVVERSGGSGVTESDVVKVLPVREEGVTVCDVIQDLLNFEVIYSVGVGVPLLITHEHSKVWLYSNVEGNKVSPLHPWTSVVPGELDTNLLGKLEKKIVSYIISNPGVTMQCLLEKYTCILFKTSLLKLLKASELNGSIRGYTLKTTPINSHCNLFSAPPTYHITGYHDNDDPSTVYFEAIVSADVV